jgi:hypothetical protein
MRLVWQARQRLGWHTLASGEHLQPTHLYHVTAARPELTRYLALPYGFRVRLEGGEHIWFDEEVARQPSP